MQESLNGTARIFELFQLGLCLIEYRIQSPRVVSKYACIDIENFAKYIGNSTGREFWKIKPALHEIVEIKYVYCIISEGVDLIYIVYMCVFRIFLCKTHMGPHIWLAFKTQKWTCSHLHHCMKRVQIWSFSGLYFLIFGLNMTKYGPEKTPYWDTFHALHVKSSTCDYAN